MKSVRYHFAPLNGSSSDYTPTAADQAKFSADYKVNMGKKFDRIVQILQGRRKESFADDEFWVFVVVTTQFENTHDQYLARQIGSKLNILWEAISTYLIRLATTQGRIRNFEKEEGVMLRTLEAGTRKRHGSYERTLDARGVYKAFEKYILIHEPAEDLTLMALAISMLAGYRNCQCCFRSMMFADHKDRYMSALTKCIQASARLDPFLRLGLASAVPRILYTCIPSETNTPVGQDLLRIGNDMCQMLVKNGVAAFTLQQLTLKAADPLECLGRKFNSVPHLTHLAHYFPNFVEACRTDLFIECIITFFRHFGNLNPFSADSATLFLENFSGSFVILGAKITKEKFLPKFLEVIPDDFLTRLYSNPDWFGDNSGHDIEPAATLFYAGRFKAHRELASVIVRLFKEPEIKLTRYIWDFLHGAYAVPTFKEEYFKNVPGCDSVMLAVLRAAISTQWVPNEMKDRGDKVHVITIDVGSLRQDGVGSGLEAPMVMCPRCHFESMVQGRCIRGICHFYEPTLERAEVDKFRPLRFRIDLLSLRADKLPNGRASVAKAQAHLEEQASRDELDKRMLERERKLKSQAQSSASVEKKESSSLQQQHKSPVEKSSPQQPVDGSLLMTCNTCGRCAADMMMCGRCQQARYCNRDCQKADWKKGHKQGCQSSTAV